MRFGLFQEGHCVPGESLPDRFAQMVEEVQLAEEMGFSFYGTSEQHFLPEGATVSSPEVWHTWVAAKTTSIRIRPGGFVLLPFNNPVRLAERIATMDMLSGGRLDVMTMRSNNLATLDYFGLSADDTRKYWKESLEIITKALGLEEFEHKGEVWEYPLKSLTPKPVQRPHPPLSVGATSVKTHGIAGQMGLGVITGNSLPGGWDYVAECVETYRTGIAEAAPPPYSFVNDSIGVVSLTAHCAETREQAVAEARHLILDIVHVVTDLWKAMAAASNDYAYMAEIDRVQDRKTDVDHLIERSPYFTVGTPDDFVARARLLAEMGLDEFWLRIDGLGHEANMRSIELIGRHVIPEFEEAGAREVV